MRASIRRENESPTGRNSNKKENLMIRVTTLATSILCATLFSSLGAAQELSRYRDFEFGMNIESVARLTHLNASVARTVHQRPEVIQTLDWDADGYLDTSPKAESIRDIRFHFYNDELYKMVVVYDPAQTKGLTADDLIEALSHLYGSASKPETSVVVSGFLTYNDNEKVLARWENAEYSFNLFHSRYGNSFGLVLFSKKLELLASAAGLEAGRLDVLEAPARAIALQKKHEEDEQELQEKARLINKPKFRP
jgi:hypothetical protein